MRSSPIESERMNKESIEQRDKHFKDGSGRRNWATHTDCRQAIQQFVDIILIPFIGHLKFGHVIVRKVVQFIFIPTHFYLYEIIRICERKCLFKTLNYHRAVTFKMENV